MLVFTAIIFVLGLLPAYVAGQVVVEARCLSGYEWTYNRQNQSPCYVAGVLSAVCSSSGQFTVPALPPGYHYLGPRTTSANSCRCSTVTYSLISACGYCQGADYITWSEYRYNCTAVYSQVYNNPIPSGVGVPAWAYLDVVTSNTFNATRARLTSGTDSTGSGPAPTVVAN